MVSEVSRRLWAAATQKRKSPFRSPLDHPSSRHATRNQPGAWRIPSLRRYGPVGSNRKRAVSRRRHVANCSPREKTSSFDRVDERPVLSAAGRVWIVTTRINRRRQVDLPHRWTQTPLDCIRWFCIFLSKRSVYRTRSNRCMIPRVSDQATTHRGNSYVAGLLGTTRSQSLRNIRGSALPSVGHNRRRTRRWERTVRTRHVRCAVANRCVLRMRRAHGWQSA